MADKRKAWDILTADILRWRLGGQRRKEWGRAYESRQI
jgi:hypothetical protein